MDVSFIYSLSPVGSPIWRRTIQVNDSRPGFYIVPVWLLHHIRAPPGRPPRGEPPRNGFISRRQWLTKYPGIFVEQIPGKWPNWGLNANIAYCKFNNNDGCALETFLHPSTQASRQTNKWDVAVIVQKFKQWECCVEYERTTPRTSIHRHTFLTYPYSMSSRSTNEWMNE